MPVIIARLLGVADLANVEGETGLYVPPDDAEVLPLKEAMQRLGADAALRTRMGGAGRERIVNHFGWQQHVEQWQHLYARGTLMVE